MVIDVAMTLRKMRRRLDLSQRELAELAEIKQTTVSALERGLIGNPRINTIRALAKALGRAPAEVHRAIVRSVTEAA